MRGTMTSMLAGLVLLPALTAADKPATPAEQLEALKKEVESERAKFSQAYEKAKTEKEQQQLRDTQNKQIGACARRALELARKHPKDPAAVDALVWIIAGGLGYNGAGNEIEAAFDLLRKDYVASDKIQRACGIAFVYDSVSTKPERFLRSVIEKNPHRDIQAAACYSLVRVIRRQASGTERARDPAVIKQWEKFMNPDVLKRYKEGDPKKLLKETEELLERIIAKYGDVKTLRSTYGKLAEAMLFEMRHLLIGKTAPEIEGEGIDGKHFKLSDYRGKVVVLDFWGHW